MMILILILRLTLKGNTKLIILKTLVWLIPLKSQVSKILLLKSNSLKSINVSTNMNLTMRI